ncbi:MAG: DUF3341 domain-containing protein [Planctomycetota bacterium]|jgi:hypothetical protein|nr:DUF3341 domain-containing protein [Planctomycetota bacterium]MDP6763634.1 DUF3341 domain-containing protein [Planctomycetota bacterium]
MTRLAQVGLFEAEEHLLAAIAESRSRGLVVVDAYSPYPIHGIDELMGIRRSRLTLVCFFGGLLGLSLGLWFQYWSSATDWPLNVGGKPFDSLPAFMPVGFELTVLFGGLSTALALLVRSRLWPGKRGSTPPGVTDDRFALVIARSNTDLPSSELPELLRRHGALDVWREGDR